MRRILCGLLILFSWTIVVADSYNILCFFPTISKSQVVFAKPLLVALAQKGHNITLVSTFSVHKTITNYHEIIIPVDMKSHSELTSSIASGERSGNILAIMSTLYSNSIDTTIKTLHHADMKHLLESNQFDGVIHGFSANTFQLGIGVHFKCPSIVLNSAPLVPPIARLVSHPMHPEAVPNFLANFKGNMNFFQRVINFGITTITHLLGLYVDYNNEQLYNEHFPSSKYPSYDEAKKNIALLLVNDHFTQGAVRPLLPNTLEVSGLQMTDKVEPLPDDIRQFVEEATDGLIFVSFGTNVRSADMTPPKRAALINTFAKLKQRVLWKFEDDSLTDIPSNVMIKKWLPQNDILAHRNTKVFVSHMGIGGYNEAMYHSVPVLAIPFGGDQFANAKKAANDEWAEIIEYPELTQDIFERKLFSLLQQTKYKSNVKRISSLYRDRPLSAIETAIFWIEYVIRHNGAKHLQYPGVELNFFQQNSLDVIGFLFVVFYIVLKTFKFILKKLFSICCKGKKTDQKMKKQ
ncbi:UDP-glucosyltransferase 2 [Pseudolycoriella hygida]|uniref:UDP-glucosyltransferase 2 n=1 Tax=Pseudolycoriella hygida TaxID=35572 RepID=A0A9Q0S2M6_9DIPT|nr:UDP-glucosyltransferase 2 [Pseudolycoriella hygida]